MIACDILYHPAGFGHGHRWLAMHCPDRRRSKLPEPLAGPGSSSRDIPRTKITRRPI